MEFVSRTYSFRSQILLISVDTLSTNSFGVIPASSASARSSAMLIGSGLEEYIVALLTFEAGDAVREYDLVGVSDVRLAGCVGNRVVI